jgi:hypothetical protein
MIKEGDLHTQLIAMKSSGYLPSQVRKHCISGIFFKERGSQASIIGLTFRNPLTDRSLVYHLNVLCDDFEDGDVQHVKDVIRLIDEIWGNGEWNSANKTYWTRRVF